MTTWSPSSADYLQPPGAALRAAGGKIPIEEVYGLRGARTLVGNTETKLILRAGDQG